MTAAGIAALFAPHAFAEDLLVSNLSNLGSNTVLRYNGQTGAFVGNSLPPEAAGSPHRGE